MTESTRADQNGAAQQTECRQCGTCCRKGGPALHLEDLPLVASGKIPLAALFTIRQTEPAFDNVNNAIAPAVTDIIKVKTVRQMTNACYFYDRRTKNCRQYADRPSECAALKCWDATDIQNLYNCRRLTRRHVLAKVKGLWDLVEDHQERCDYGYIAELAEKVRRSPGPGSAQQELLELIRYDDSLRQVTRERMPQAEEMLEFLFGRPLSFTIQMFKIKYQADCADLIVDTNTEAPSGVCYRRNGF